MLKSIISNFVVLILLLILYSCSSPSENKDSQDLSNSYTPLNVGVVKQYVYASDGTYLNIQISGKAIREDGQEVFIEEVNSSSLISQSIHTDYIFIRNGYYYSSSLINRKVNESPYQEIRVAKPFPQNGDVWNSFENEKGTVEFKSIYVGKMTTPAGLFKDVYNFRYVDKNAKDTANVFYARGIGYIGTTSKTETILLNYIKIGDIVYGKQQPYAILPKKQN